MIKKNILIILIFWLLSFYNSVLASWENTNSGSLVDLAKTANTAQRTADIAHDNYNRCLAKWTNDCGIEETAANNAQTKADTAQRIVDNINNKNKNPANTDEAINANDKYNNARLAAEASKRTLANEKAKYSGCKNKATNICKDIEKIIKEKKTALKTANETLDEATKNVNIQNNISQAQAEYNKVLKVKNDLYKTECTEKKPCTVDQKIDNAKINNVNSIKKALDDAKKVDKAYKDLKKQQTAVEKANEKLKTKQEAVKTAKKANSVCLNKKSVKCEKVQTKVDEANKDLKKQQTAVKTANENLKNLKESYNKSLNQAIASKSDVAEKEIILDATQKANKKIDPKSDTYDQDLKDKKEALETLAKAACSWNDVSACEKAKKKALDSKKEYDEKSKFAKEDITSRSFIIWVNDISPWLDVNKSYNTEKNVNFVLGTIITKLLIWLWTLSVLIMTVGWGYMILNWGKDELLNKWKSIFMSGLFSMIVALGAYYIIVAVRYILYF